MIIDGNRKVSEAKVYQTVLELKQSQQIDILIKYLHIAMSWDDCDRGCGYGGCTASCQGRSKKRIEMMNYIDRIRYENKNKNT